MSEASVSPRVLRGYSPSCQAVCETSLMESVLALLTHSRCADGHLLSSSVNGDNKTCPVCLPGLLCGPNGMWVVVTLVELCHTLQVCAGVPAGPGFQARAGGGEADPAHQDIKGFSPGCAPGSQRSPVVLPTCAHPLHSDGLWGF